MVLALCALGPCILLLTLDGDANTTPAWGELPVLEATEDVPFSYDFSANVSNPDGPLEDLVITSTSPYVTLVSGLSVTFLFGEGVTEAMVLLQLRDGDLTVPAHVRFRVLPVNDPPSHCIPPMLGPTEDVPFVLDLTPYIWDVDNPVSDLFLTIEDDVVLAEGFVIEALFPNGVLDYRATGVLSDGLATTEVVLVFSVEPVDDHFTMDLPDNITIIEDVPYVFDLADYITDEDSSLDDLWIKVSLIDCRKKGTVLTFLEERGGRYRNAKIEVFEDGRDYGYLEYMRVYVQEVNDAPVVDAIPDVRLAEHMNYRLELGDYVSDEETPIEGLSLIFDADDPTFWPTQVVGVDDLNLTLHYDVWEPPHALRLGVTDGEAITWVDVAVEVVDVNDAPTVLVPSSVFIDEGTELWLTIEANDEDGEELLYFVASDFHGLEAHDNGTLRVWAEKGEVGDYSALVSVTDPRGAYAKFTLLVGVMNVNDPPKVPVVQTPLDGSVQVSGAVIAFDVEVGDPDTRFGQVVIVSWVSDLEGELEQRRSDQAMGFQRSLDIPGTHRVTVTVDDGEFERSATVVVEVREPRPEGPVDSGWHAWLAVAAVAVVAGLYLGYRMRREKT